MSNLEKVAQLIMNWTSACNDLQKDDQK